MTTGEQLLRAILEEPADNDRRLVYSDWLEDNGQEDHAQLIRCQIEAAALEEKLKRSTPPGVASWLDLLRSRRLADSILNGSGLREQYLFGDQFLDNLWERGFIAEVRAPAISFKKHAEKLFAAHPVERVLLVDVSPSYTDREPGFTNCFAWEWMSLSKINWLVNEGFLLAGSASCRKTEAECIEDLLVACVNWGRSLVGLPPLEAKA